MSWMVVFNAIGAALGIFLATALAWHSSNAAANRWLALFLLAYSLVLVCDVLDESRLLRAVPHLAHVGDWLLFLLGPLLWQYVRTLTARAGQAAGQARHFLLHCIPAGLLLLVMLPFFLLPGERKHAILEDEWRQPRFDVTDSVPLLVLIVQIGIYLALCFAHVRRYHRALGEFYSNVEKRRIDWLWMTLAGAVGLFVVWLIWLATQTRWTRSLDALGFPVVVYLLGYFGLRQPQVFAPGIETASTSEAPVAAAAPPANHSALLPSADVPDTAGQGARAESGAAARAPKYEKSALSQELAQQYRTRIEAHVALEKPYLESDLTLAELAQGLSMPQHHLSQLLNAHLGQSFFDFINQRRVEEVKRCLRDPRYASQTILEIGLASGFSSKATFNAAFKKFVRLTPSQYRLGE